MTEDPIKAAYMQGRNDREDDLIAGVRRIAPTPANHEESVDPRLMAVRLAISERVIDERTVGGLALLLSEHFGTRPILAMARDRSDLRSKIRDGGGYDINEPTIDDLEEAARAILAYLKGEVE